MPSLASLASRARDFFGRRMGQIPGATGGNTGLGSLAGQMRQRGRPPRSYGRTLPERIDIPDTSRTPPPVDPRLLLQMLESFERRGGRNPYLEQLAEEITAPPVQGTGAAEPPVERPPDITTDDDDFAPADAIEMLGRDVGYRREDFEEMQAGMTRVSSSNVYSYAYQTEGRMSGVLYVTFLAPAAKGEPRTEPGPTYAYYGVTRAVYQRFKTESESSPGSAVWDYLRVRGTLWGHRFNYRLVHVAGEYVPRRVTQEGFRTRTLPPVGTPREVRDRLPRDASGRVALSRDPDVRQQQLERAGFRRSTLPEYTFPDRGTPDRGEPNRG